MFDGRLADDDLAAKDFALRREWRYPIWFCTPSKLRAASQRYRHRIRMLLRCGCFLLCRAAAFR